MSELRVTQLEVGSWSLKNFGHQPYTRPFMGVVEEVGELSHAMLKQEQGIRGTNEMLEAKAKDAVGDILIYLLDLCEKRGWDAETILKETWAQVKIREWNAASTPNREG